MDTVLHECEERDDKVAVGSICPMPGCGALVIAFRATYVFGPDHIQPWSLGACVAELSSSCQSTN